MSNTTLVFCYPKSKWLLLSPVIRKIQGLPYSHSVIFKDGNVYESTFPISKKTKEEEWLKKYVVVEKHKVKVDEKILESLLDRPYSVLQLLWALFDVKSVLNGRVYLICTEFCALSMGYSNADAIDLHDLKTLALEQASQFDS